MGGREAAEWPRNGRIYLQNGRRIVGFTFRMAAEWSDLIAEWPQIGRRLAADWPVTPFCCTTSGWSANHLYRGVAPEAD